MGFAYKKCIIKIQRVMERTVGAAIQGLNSRMEHAPQFVDQSSRCRQK